MGTELMMDGELLDGYKTLMNMEPLDGYGTT
jgi:hypothetical protein